MPLCAPTIPAKKPNPVLDPSQETFKQTDTKTKRQNKKDPLQAFTTDLLKKAQENVEIRLLVDSVGGRLIPRKRINELRAAGIDVAFFFPSKTKYMNLRANYRNHWHQNQ